MVNDINSLFFFIDVLKNVLKFALNLTETQLTKHKCNGNRLSEQIITHSHDVLSLHRPLQALFVISGWRMTHLNAHRAVIRNSPKAQNCLFPLSSVLSVVIHPLSFFFIWLALFNIVILLLPLLQWHLTGKLAPPTAYLNEPTPNIHWAVVDREAMRLVFSPLQCLYNADIWVYWSGGSKIPSNTVKCCHAKPRTCTLAFGYMAFYIFPC